MVTGYPVTVIAHITHNNNRTWDITINRRGEYPKLLMTDFPVTVGTKGKPLELIKGNDQCTTTLHRLNDGRIWISSATDRLGDPAYTGLFHKLLAMLGILVEKSCKGQDVKLKFISKGQAIIT